MFTKMKSKPFSATVPPDYYVPLHVPEFGSPLDLCPTVLITLNGFKMRLTAYYSERQHFFLSCFLRLSVLVQLGI